MTRKDTSAFVKVSRASSFKPEEDSFGRKFSWGRIDWVNWLFF